MTSRGRTGILEWGDPALSQSGELGGMSRCFCLIVCDALRYNWLQYWFAWPWALRRQVMGLLPHPVPEQSDQP